MATITKLSTLRRASLCHSYGRSIPTMQRCWYRGDSGEGQPNLSAAEEILLQIAKPKSQAIMERHVRLPSIDGIPKSSLGEADALEIRQKRLVYRSKQRGWLEVDLLLGTWANENVSSLSSEELDELEAFVNLETIDIYNIITLRTEIPDEIRSGVVERIQEWARNSPLGRADPQTYAKVKTDNNLI